MRHGRLYSLSDKAVKLSVHARVCARPAPAAAHSIPVPPDGVAATPDRDLGRITRPGAQ